MSDQAIDRSNEPPNKVSTSEGGSLGTLDAYELISMLGEGGMGAVYKARHTKLDKIVAIKVLPADRMRDKGAVARFEREMRAVGKLEHPNIVRAMDAGEAGGTHYLVMEYVQGVDLSKLVKECSPLPIADACELIRQAAVALDEAHDNGMVHRDIKPSNIMLCVVSKRKPPVVKVLDMGLALLSESHSADVQGLTMTGQTMGTLDYMAPEQGGDSKNVDIRADIYALGASLYKLLCGEVIYFGEEYQTPVQKMMALATHPAPPIQRRRKGVSNELAAVLHRMLEKNPNKRFATPDQVAQALAPFCFEANLTSLLNSVGFAIAPTKDSSPSATQASFSQPDADTGVVKQLPKSARVPGKPAQLAKPPIPPGDKTNPWLAKAPAPKSSPTPRRLDKPIAPAAPKLPAPVPHIQTRPRPTKSVAKASAGRKLPPWLPLTIGGGLLGFGGIVALAAAITFYFQTPGGTLRVEIDDPSIEVTVKGTDIVLKQADNEEITLMPGEHTLVVKRGDFKFDTRDFELKKGETTTVKVQLLPGKVLVVTTAGVILGEEATDTFVAKATEAGTSSRPGEIVLDNVHEQSNISAVLPENWKATDVFADIRGAGRVEFPVLPLSSYVLELDLEVRDPQGLTKFTIGEAVAATDICLGGLWSQDFVKSAVPCRFFRIQPFAVNWDGERHFAANKRMRLKVVAADDRKALYYDGAPILFASGAAADFRLVIEANERANAIVYSASLRPLRLEDTKALGWVFPRTRIESNISKAKSRREGQIDPDLATKPDTGRPFRVATSDTPMVWIAPTTFTMGLARAPRDEIGKGNETVRFSSGYWIGKYEVTQQEWLEIARENPSRVQGSPYLPANWISWTDCCQLAMTLTEIEKREGRLPEGYEYRLPTEAEWEFACRAGTDKEFPVDRKSINWREAGGNHLTEVGMTKSNAWGLYDMQGNAPEWCLDSWVSYTGLKDPVLDRFHPGDPASDMFVVRGGAYWLPGGMGEPCSSYLRFRQHDVAGDHRGMRLVLGPILTDRIPGLSSN